MNLAKLGKEYFQNTIASDFLRLFAGEHLGSGVGRTVFLCAIDPTLVVKVETASQSFQNIAEWGVWHDLKDTKAAEWFAPCVNISACGTVMLQKRTRKPHLQDFPERIPAFLSDTKRQNFGLLDGRLVAHDYGYNNLTIKGAALRLVKAKWWSEDGDE